MESLPRTNCPPHGLRLDRTDVFQQILAGLDPIVRSFFRSAVAGVLIWRSNMRAGVALSILLIVRVHHGRHVWMPLHRAGQKHLHAIGLIV